MKRNIIKIDENACIESLRIFLHHSLQQITIAHAVTSLFTNNLFSGFNITYSQKRCKYWQFDKPAAF